MQNTDEGILPQESCINDDEYNLMKQCWKRKRGERIDLSKLKEQFLKMRLKVASSGWWFLNVWNTLTISSQLYVCKKIIMKTQKKISKFLSLCRSVAFITYASQTEKHHLHFRKLYHRLKLREIVKNGKTLENDSSFNVLGRKLTYISMTCSTMKLQNYVYNAVCKW